MRLFVKRRVSPSRLTQYSSMFFPSAHLYPPPMYGGGLVLEEDKMPAPGTHALDKEILKEVAGINGEIGSLAKKVARLNQTITEKYGTKCGRYLINWHKHTKDLIEQIDWATSFATPRPPPPPPAPSEPVAHPIYGDPSAYTRAEDFIGAFRRAAHMGGPVATSTPPPPPPMVLASVPKPSGME